MTLTTHIARTPHVFAPDRADSAAARFEHVAPELCDLIAGAAGSAPYLADLIAKEADWLEGAVDAPVEALAHLQNPVDAPMGTHLRRGKRRMALLVALADLGGAWPLARVTQALTEFADYAVDAALRDAHTRLQAKLPAALEDFDASGLVMIAMGKMGAYELNYSSDIDLIALFDERRHSAEDLPEVRAGLVKIVRLAMRTLSDVTSEGYVFRTDLRLRPDAAVTPVVLSMGAAEQYYEAEGRTWERAAHIKARPAVGDAEAGAAYLERLRPFIWRRHLDFAAIQDAHDMQEKIRAHKGLRAQAEVAGHDLKLGFGGIRAIEFFTQTRQLISGGRDPGLRQRDTCGALAALSTAGWIEPQVAQELTAAYETLRTWEHRVQMLNDAQTHQVPSTEEGLNQVAALMGQSADELKREMRALFDQVHDLTEGFFAPQSQTVPVALPSFGEEITSRWPQYPALRSDRASELFREVQPMILAALDRAADPEAALRAFDQFLSGLPAGVQVFALFKSNPQLIDLLLDICGSVPALAEYLGRNAGVLDAVIGGNFFDPWPGRDALLAEFTSALAREADYERKLDALRQHMKEWHFRIGVHHLRGVITADEAGLQYAELAEACVGALWPAVVDEFARKHGRPPGRGAAILAMGSFGMEQCHARSDLDLILIYDAEGQEASDGPKPLHVRMYFARLTQALVTALSAPMAQGRLYEVDLRLRPSGRKGPVATSWESFQAYQREEAWTWERLALTRARVVAGEASLRDDLERFRVDALALATANADDAGLRARDVADMRARLKAEKWGTKAWDVKDGAGGLQDLDLFLQLMTLLAGSDARRPQDQIKIASEALEGAAGVELDAARALYWQVQAFARLLADEGFDPDALGAGAVATLLASTGQTSMTQLGEALTQARAATAGTIEASLDRFGES